MDVFQIKMNYFPRLWYTDTMNIYVNTKKDGFAGETLIVLSTETFIEYIDNPIVRRLYLTDAGYFPCASGHYRERPEGVEEYILLCCTTGRGTVEVAGRSYLLRENETFCIPYRMPEWES